MTQSTVGGALGSVVWLCLPLFLGPQLSSLCGPRMLLYLMSPWNMECFSTQLPVRIPQGDFYISTPLEISGSMSLTSIFFLTSIFLKSSPIYGLIKHILYINTYVESRKKWYTEPVCIAEIETQTQRTNAWTLGRGRGSRMNQDIGTDISPLLCIK